MKTKEQIEKSLKIVEEQILEHYNTREDVAKAYASFLYDVAEDDTEIRKLCKEVMNEDEVEGDSYGVPGVVELVEKLVNEIKTMKSEILSLELDKLNK